MNNIELMRFLVSGERTSGAKIAETERPGPGERASRDEWGLNRKPYAHPYQPGASGYRFSERPLARNKLVRAAIDSGMDPAKAETLTMPELLVLPEVAQQYSSGYSAETLLPITPAFPPDLYKPIAAPIYSSAIFAKTAFTFAETRYGKSIQGPIRIDNVGFSVYSNGGATSGTIEMGVDGIGTLFVTSLAAGGSNDLTHTMGTGTIIEAGVVRPYIKVYGTGLLLVAVSAAVDVVATPVAR